MDREFLDKVLFTREHLAATKSSFRESFANILMTNKVYNTRSHDAFSNTFKFPLVYDQRVVEKSYRMVDVLPSFYYTISLSF